MRRRWAGVVGTAAGFLGLPAVAAQEALPGLASLSIEELSQIDVSSVSKAEQPLRSAPAAIFVITREAIERSGALTVPEMLRLAPNLHVAQTSSSAYVITARGLNGSSQAQNFSNKLLVLIDGRTVYTPLFSGVYWDMQAVVPDDVDRIEIISGPGATLWGANAVNGVINIITRGAGDTQGGVVTASAGNFDRNFAARYGGRIGEHVAYRVYVTALDNRQTRTLTGAEAGDDWNRVQGGFRIDWSPSATDRLTLQGDIYGGSEGRLGQVDEDISGRNILAKWSRKGDVGAELQVQGFYDRTRRAGSTDGGSFTLDTYDLNVQQSFDASADHAIVVGGGLRVSKYDIVGTPAFFFDPARRTLTLANVFVQDTIRLGDDLKLTGGLKLEDNPYSGTALLPTLRVAWTPTGRSLLWAAVSRAIRSPTPFDTDVVEKPDGTTFLIGNPEFQPETLIAYEAGTRLQMSDVASLSISLFYNNYDKLRNIELAPAGFLPLRWGNGLGANTYGAEAWADYAVTPWWRLSASVSFFRKEVGFVEGATTILGPAQLGNDPAWRVGLRSAMTRGSLTFDSNLRYVSVLPEPRVPAYVELDARLGWLVNDRMRVSIAGFNLLHRVHQEFPAPATAVPRRVVAEVQWRF